MIKARSCMFGGSQGNTQICTTSTNNYHDKCLADFGTQEIARYRSESCIEERVLWWQALGQVMTVPSEFSSNGLYCTTREYSNQSWGSDSWLCSPHFFLHPVLLHSLNVWLW